MCIFICFENVKYRTHSFPLVDSVNNVQPAICHSVSQCVYNLLQHYCLQLFAESSRLFLKYKSDYHSKMSKLERRPCHFNKSLQKKYPFLRQQKDKTDSYVFCEICFSNFNIANGGLTHIRRHITTAKHLQASKESAGSQLSLDESIVHKRRKRAKVRGTKHVNGVSTLGGKNPSLLGKKSDQLYQMN